jgi:hypothetical protein
MKRFKVSLDIVSDSLTLSELAAKLGIEPSSGSHSKGDPRGVGEFRSTEWKLFSMLPDTADLEEHIKAIAVLFPPEALVNVLPEGCKVFMDIGVFFDGWNCVVLISREMRLIINAYNAEIELNCYPS